MNLGQRMFQIGDQRGKVTLGRGLRSPDQNIIPPGAGMRGHHGAGKGAQTALGAVSRHGVSKFFGAGKADANDVGRNGFIGVASPRLQQEASGALPAGRCGAQKIGALAQGFNPIRR